MSDRADQLRARAAECLVLAKRAMRPEVRAGLLILAQKLYELAKSEPTRAGHLDHAISSWNEDQMRGH